MDFYQYSFKIDDFEQKIVPEGREQFLGRFFSFHQNQNKNTGPVTASYTCVRVSSIVSKGSLADASIFLKSHQSLQEMIPI